MEAAAGVTAAGHAVSLPVPSSQLPRKEWRAVSEHSIGNSSNEELELSKMGQSDERLIYEGREPADVDFCCITIDENSDSDILQQRLLSVMKQKEELQQMEIDLRAQLIARLEIIEMRNTYDAKIKEHANATVKLQEQLHEREQTIHELERKIEEKERELHAIRLDNEAAWAKEDLLREQNKELATFRRERDNADAERAQHLKEIHDLQEHIQEKERRFMELQEQHRVAQETILFKDEQLREAQAWITRAQEMDALQSTTNHSLQTELRERAEQYNQLWLGCQRQLAEMETLHMHHIQQLHLELADVRQRSGNYSDESRVSQNNSKDGSHFGQSNGSQLEVSRSGTPNENSGCLSTGNAEIVSSFVSTGNTSTLIEHIPGVPIAPSLIGMPAYLSPGQVTTLHPFVMHQKGIPHSVPSHIPQSHVGHFHSASPTSALQQWQNQQAASEGSQIPLLNHYQPSQAEQNLMTSDPNYDYEVPVNEQALHTDYFDAHMTQGIESHSVVPSSNEEGQVGESINRSYLVSSHSQQKLQQISSQFHDALRLDSPEQKNETKENNANSLANHGIEAQGLLLEQPSSAANIPDGSTDCFSETTMHSATGALLPEGYVTSGQKNAAVATGKTPEVTLLDERSLLACIIRTIPPGSGGRIRTSSTLPNRLGKMLAPLHWHDYKKKYGKLDDFVASHPELFVIEGDYIQLREGAQEIIAATAAVAKVAAATAVTSHSSLLPSVAVTPMAHANRLKKFPSIDSKSLKDDKIIKETVAPRPGNATDNPLQPFTLQNQHSNGVSCSVSGGVPTVKILTKPKGYELNGSELRPGQASVSLMVENGASSNKSDLGSCQNKGSFQGRLSPSSNAGKQQGRRHLGSF